MGIAGIYRIAIGDDEPRVLEELKGLVVRSLGAEGKPAELVRRDYRRRYQEGRLGVGPPMPFAGRWSKVSSPARPAVSLIPPAKPPVPRLYSCAFVRMRCKRQTINHCCAKQMNKGWERCGHIAGTASAELGEKGKMFKEHTNSYIPG